MEQKTHPKLYKERKKNKRRRISVMHLRGKREGGGRKGVLGMLKANGPKS